MRLNVALAGVCSVVEEREELQVALHESWMQSCQRDLSCAILFLILPVLDDAGVELTWS